MPSLESDDVSYSVECETTLSTTSSKGDFPSIEEHGPKITLYGSIAQGLDQGPPARNATPSTTKDEECRPLLPGRPPGPLGDVRMGGLTRADLMTLVDDPFWRRLRTLLLGCFWLLIAAMIGFAAWFVAVDTDRCTPLPSVAPAITTPLASAPAPGSTPPTLLLHAVMSKY